jgi:hypothetical protein
MPANLKHPCSHSDVQAQLDRVLSSKAFRTSSRSQEFLRFVVGRVLEGNEQSIKERNIAVEVFGRDIDYNTSEDSFVRVKASEVRRRLQSYYSSPSEGDVLRIEVPVGTYVPQFVRIGVEPSGPAIETASKPARRAWFWSVGVAAVLITTAVTYLLLARAGTPIDDFWAPIRNSPEPLAIFLPIPSSFAPLSDKDAAPLNEPPWQAVSPTGEHRLFATAPHKVGLGAAVGAIRFATLCARTGKTYTLKAGMDFSFADLRNQASVLFGAFSSPWTAEINNEYRFRFVRGPAIQDEQNPSRQWRPVPGPHYGTPSEDYALATRVFEPKSGRIVIIAAGLSTFGTEAAAEFLTEPSRMAELAKRAPQPLNKGNFQVLLHTKVIGNTPTPAVIVDTHFW